MSKDRATSFHVYGVVTEIPYSDNPQDWLCEWLAEQVEAQGNPVTMEPAPFTEEQPLTDFSEACTSNMQMICLLSVNKQDGICDEILDVLPGNFAGFD
jgi:hypothetical protein